MTLFYHRPIKLIKFTPHSIKTGQRKRRRPYDKSEINFTFVKQDVQSNNDSSDESNNEKNPTKSSTIEMKHDVKDEDNGNNGDTVDCVDGKTFTKMETDEENSAIEHNGNSITSTSKDDSNVPGDETVNEKEKKEILNTSKKRVEKKLDNILKRLMDKLDSGLSRLNHIKSSHHQHVSPRKRILREFEKVSLEDTQTIQKRSRAKTIGATGINSSLNSAQTSKTVLVGRPNSPQSTANLPMHNAHSHRASNGSNHQDTTHTVSASGTSSIPIAVSSANTNSPSNTQQSRISSYSITSLLGYNTDSSSNNNCKKDTNSKITSFVDSARSLAVKSPSSPTDSRYSSSYTPSNSNKKRSPTYGTPSPHNSSASNQHNLEYYNMMRSPDLSPSPEHQLHPFPRYRSPSAFNMMMSSSSPLHSNLTPTSSSIRSSPSPSNSDNYNSKYRSNYLSGSPSHPYSAVSPSHRHSPIPGYQNRKSPHIINKSAAMQSPTRYTGNNNGGPSTSRSSQGNKSPSISPTVEEHQLMPKEVVPSPGVRNLPKKTAALRQQFNQQQNTSPPISSSHGSTSTTPTSSLTVREQLMLKEREKEHEQIRREVERSKSLQQQMHANMSSMEALDPFIRSSLHSLAPPQHSPAMYPYMYPPAGIPTHPPSNPYLSSYYQQVYAAAAAAAYRNPLWMHYPAALAGPPPMQQQSEPPHSPWPIAEQRSVHNEPRRRVMEPPEEQDAGKNTFVSSIIYYY